MATLTLNKSAKARNLLQNSNECPICKAAGYRLRPEVEQSIRDSINGIGLSPVYDNLDDFFKSLDE